MTWAKEDARLDFVTHSEHDIWLDDSEWEHLKDNVEYSERVALSPIWGTSGQREIYMAATKRTVRNTQGLRISTSFIQPCRNYTVYAGKCQRRRHRHSPCASGEVPPQRSQLQPMVEIMSQHGSFEWFGRKYLDHGHRVGFTAASDGHLNRAIPPRRDEDYPSGGTRCSARRGTHS